jgi:hypothetical protein
MNQQPESPSNAFSSEYIDIVLVEREARRLRAEHLAAAFRAAAGWLRRAVRQRAPGDNVTRSPKPSLG